MGLTTVSHERFLGKKCVRQNGDLEINAIQSAHYEIERNGKNFVAYVNFRNGEPKTLVLVEYFHFK